MTNTSILIALVDLIFVIICPLLEYITIFNTESSMLLGHFVRFSAFWKRVSLSFGAHRLKFTPNSSRFWKKTIPHSLMATLYGLNLPPLMATN